MRAVSSSDMWSISTTLSNNAQKWRIISCARTLSFLAMATTVNLGRAQCLAEGTTGLTEIFPKLQKTGSSLSALNLLYRGAKNGLGFPSFDRTIFFAHFRKGATCWNV